MDCVVSLRLAAVLIGLRSIESVCISTQRAFERYGPAVRLSAIARLASLLLGAALTFVVHHVAVIVATTVVMNGAATLLQFRDLEALLAVRRLRPAFHVESIRRLFRFGCYSWVLAATGILFGQADRLVLGLWLGAAPVAGYALCTQLAQPIYGVAAAGLHFLFPYLSNRSATQEPKDLRHAVGMAASWNLIFVVVAALVLQLIGPRLLALLGRGALPPEVMQLLGPIAWGTALVGLSVTPTYALYAFHRIRLVTLFNVVGSLICIVLMVWLGRSMGATGIAWARLGYGAFALLLYLPLVQLFRASSDSRMRVACCEDV